MRVRSFRRGWHLRVADAVGRCLFLILAIGANLVTADASTLDDLWRGNAHFEQVREVDWHGPGGLQAEEASWFAVHAGSWYAFSRVTIGPPGGQCPALRMKVVVRRSRDQGRTWSPAQVAVAPRRVGRGDGCAVLDGSSYFDASAATWHMLAQCLDSGASPRWSLCHYVRVGDSPMGPFVADPTNPVVRGGSLWSKICTGTPNSCPHGTVDEGTPEIVSKTGRDFLITFHGFAPLSGRGFRGQALTRDFRQWRVTGAGLLGAPILGSADCAAWLAGCVGTGATSTATTKHFTYLVAETMDKSLVCSSQQHWVFQLLRASRGPSPRSGSGIWQRFSDKPLLVAKNIDPATPCQIQYPHWIIDGDQVFLVYEDWIPGRNKLHRRLLKLIPGGGPPVRR